MSLTARERSDLCFILGWLSVEPKAKVLMPMLRAILDRGPEDES